MSYQIGQYRFEGANNCLTDLSKNVSLGYRESATTAGAFSDVVLRYTGNNNGGFSSTKDYYLYVKIPQDMNYDMKFNLKLMKKETSVENSSEYQWLDDVSVPKGGTGIDSYRVVLYNTLNSAGNLNSPEQVRVTIPTTYSSSVRSTWNNLYYDEANKLYYIGTPSGGYKNMNDLASPAPYNDLFVTASWRQSYDAESYPCAIFELVFRPLEDGFTDLVLEMVRTGDDWNIQDTQDDGTTIYGRVVPIDMMEYEVCEVKDLLNRINHRPLTRIGVWGHTDTLMVINGEQIKIGPSGFYELDAVPTTSLGIVAHGYQDNFTVDYQYESLG